MPLKTLDTQVPEPEGWFQPSPARALSQSDKKARELLVQSRPWDWGSSIVKISPDFDTESFEDLLDDIQDLSFSTDEKHKTLRAIYPPQESFNSNVLILQKDSHPESENASFINVLRTAYGSDGAQTGVNSFRVNLVLKGLKTVHSFDFSDEAEYWRFLNGVRKGNRGEMENYVTGLCRLIGAHAEEDAGPANKKLLGFNIGKLPKLSTAKAPGLDGQGRFIINHNILTFKSFGPKGQLLDDEEIINLMDVWALAITSDVMTAQTHSILLQADLPEAVLKKGHNLTNFVFQLSSNESKASYPGKVCNLPITVFPVANRPSLFAVIPTSFPVLSNFLCRSNQAQELLLQIIDVAHQVDIGQQSFTPHGILAEYKPAETSFATPSSSSAASSIANGTYSPKPNKRSSGLSVVRFSEMDVSSSSYSRHSVDLNNNGAMASSSHRGSGKFAVHDPVVKLSTTQRVDTLLLSKGGERALKLVIKNASGLVATNGKVPAVYCTIYLAGKNGQRLTSNVAEMRTEPVKSLDPEWKHEIIIHDERLAKQEVEFVMVLLRDQSSGLLKHRHVGQVMIPLSCFLDTPAEFCLPIEPSYRMDNSLSQTSFIGDIHLMTHMVRGEATTAAAAAAAAGVNGAGANAAQSREKMFRVDSIRMTTFASSITVFRHAMGSTWWPVKMLHPTVTGATASAGAGAAGSTTTSSSAAGGGNANFSINLGGSTVVTPTHFSGFMLPASEALILAISNPLDFHYLPTAPTAPTANATANANANGSIVHLEVLWSDVLDSEVLSDGAVFLTVQLSAQLSAAQKFRSPSTPEPTRSDTNAAVPDKKIVELLVGPCSATKLVEWIARRKRFQDVGQNLAAIQLFKATALPASTTTSLSINSGPNSPVALARTRAPSVGRASFFSSGGNNAAMTNAARLGTFGIVETIRDTAEVIEGLFKDLQYADEGTASVSVSSSPQPTSSSSAAAAFGAASLSADVTSLTEVQRHWEQSLLRQILLYLRCKLVPAILPHIPDHEELPDFSIAYIQRAVEKDKLFYQMMVPWRVNEKMEALHERYDSFMEEVSRRIRDFVVFSSRVVDVADAATAAAAAGNGGAFPSTTSATSSSSSAAAAAAAVAVGTASQPTGLLYSDTSMVDEELPKEARFCIQVLVEKYHDVLMQSLRPYVQSKATFQAIPGQWLKNCVLKLLIEKNHQYESYIGTTLRVNGLYLTQQRPLALVENVDEVLDWFATTLLQDTRLWLSKTIEQARNKRENTYELPWDTELVGDRICSHLPESVSFQLKVFMDVCVKDFSSGRSRHHLTSGAGETTSATGGPPPPPPPTTTTVARSLFGDHTTRSTRAKADFYQVANERLLQAIAQAWILLANEYERSLLSKHWDQVKPKPEQDAYIEYLCAIANDCYRIRRDQIMALTAIRVRDDKKHELLNHLHVAFRNLQSQALGYVLRIVYSTVQRTLIDFEDLWLNPTDEQHAQHTSYATRTLLSNVRTWMLRMKQKVEYKVYRELLPNAVEVVVLRFFILFRELLAQKNGPPLRVEDLTKLTQDVEILSSMLEDLCEHDGDASYDGLDALKGGSGADGVGGGGSGGGGGGGGSNGYWVKDIPATEAALAAATRPLGPKLIEDCVKDVLLFFHTFVMLLREPVASVQFQASLHWLLYDYEHIYQANHPPYFVEFLLVHCLVPLRPPQTVNDADAFITQYHQMAIMAPPRSTATASATASASNGDAAAAEATGTAVVYGNVAAISGKRKARRNLDQHDLYWRIFGGNNKILDAMGEAFEAAGCTKPQAVAASGSGSGSGGMSATAAATFKFFSPSLATRRLGANGAAAAGGASGSVGASGAAGGGGGSGGAANGGSKSLLPLTKVVGGDLFKPLREKAADLRVFHNHRRQNEEIMAIYRLLGLGGAANDEDEDGGPSSGSGGHGGGGGVGGSTSGKVRPARGLFGSHASGDGDDDGGDSLSALEHAAGANGGASANGSTITPRALISLVASVTGGSSSHLIPANAHGTTYTGFIKISHIEVRKLHSAALFGECHPYIYFSMGAQRQKTSVKATGHAATWDDIVVLKVPSNLDVTTATMHVEVFDKELIRRKRLLGEVSIKLDGLDMRDFDSWFALEGGECAGVGEIHVKISLQKLTR